MSGQTVSTVQTSKGLSRKIVTFTFLLGIFMGALDHGIVGPALSSIFSSFQVDPSWGVWSFTIYTLTFAISIPILGKLSDRLGRKQTFMTGITLFAVGSLIAAFAPSFGGFLLGRAVQAIGAGGIFPITAAQIAATTPPEKRGQAMGWIGVAFGLGTIMGPAAGGLIISFANWQWIFLINIPISLVILGMLAGYNQDQVKTSKPIDIKGIIVLSAIILSIMYGITSKTWWMIGLGIVLVPLLVGIERKQADPVMNIAYFTKAHTRTLLLASLLSGFVMATSANFFPYFAENVLGMMKGNSGLLVTPFAIASMIASLVGGKMSDQMGAKKVLVIGFIVTLAGALALAALVHTLPLFIAISIIMGFGVGIVIGAPLNVLILQAVELKETGAAVGYLSLFRSLGSTLGPAVAGILLSLSTSGFTYMFITSAVLSLVAIGIIVAFVPTKVQKG